MSRKKKPSSPLPQAWLAEVRDDLNGKINAIQSPSPEGSKSNAKKSKQKASSCHGQAKAISDSTRLETSTKKVDVEVIADTKKSEQHKAEPKVNKCVKGAPLSQAWLADVRDDLNAKILVAERQQKGQAALTAKPKRRRPARAKQASDTSSTLTVDCHKKPGAQFLDLPVEIQTSILEYTLLQTAPIRMDALFRSLPKGPRSWSAKGCGIIYACHHLHEIGRQAFYSGNIFTVSIRLFSSMPSTMATWPRVPKAATNLAMALKYVRHLVVVHSGWGELPGPNGPEQWKPLSQFLRGFDRILSVELDLRDDDWGRYGWGQPHELDYYTEPAAGSIRQALRDAGVHIDWSAKEKGRRGIKNGSVYLRKRRSQTEHNINEAKRKLIKGIEEGARRVNQKSKE